MSNPQVSVIVTGDKSRIDDAVRSAQAQTHRDHEIIVAESRNRGIQQAKGEYVAFLYGQHLWHPRKLEEQIKANADWCYCAAAGVSTPFELPSGHILRSLLLTNFIPSSSVMARRHIFRKVGEFHESADSVSSDWDMWLRIAEYYRVQSVPETLVQLQPHNTAIEQTYSSQLDVVEAAVARHHELRELRSQALASICVSAGNSYLDANKPEAARHKFEEALVHNPLRRDPYIRWISSFFSLASQHRPRL